MEVVALLPEWGVETMCRLFTDVENICSTHLYVEEDELGDCGFLPLAEYKSSASIFV